MFYFSALIYNGYYQQLISGEFEGEPQFIAYLDNKFGVYVCLWREKYAVPLPKE